MLFQGYNLFPNTRNAPLLHLEDSRQEGLKGSRADSRRGFWEAHEVSTVYPPYNHC